MRLVLWRQVPHGVGEPTGGGANLGESEKAHGNARAAFD